MSCVYTGVAALRPRDKPITGDFNGDGRARSDSDTLADAGLADPLRSVLRKSQIPSFERRPTSALPISLIVPRYHDAG